jgi:hypothetical protein
VKVAALVALLGACSFTARDGSDAPAVIDAPPVDSIDAFGGRVRQGLIALWTFNETTGVTVADTSGSVVPGITPVQLRLSDPVTWSNGTMTIGPGGPSTVAASLTPPDVSTPTPASKLVTACLNGGGVTLEAWVDPEALDQGTMPMPVVVAGISGTINTRNISLFQAGDRWMGRVRTGANQNGDPALVAMPDEPVVAGMNHLVLVADATTRALYVNGERIAESAPGAPLTWDASHRIVLANELSLNRAWHGKFALVALYNRALPEAQIRLNWNAGPDAQ